MTTELKERERPDMPRIDAVWAFLAVDKETGNEGVCGVRSIEGQWLPAIGADLKRVESLKPAVRTLADVHGVKIRLVKFSQREVIEEYEARSRRDSLAD